MLMSDNDARRSQPRRKKPYTTVRSQRLEPCRFVNERFIITSAGISNNFDCGLRRRLWRECRRCMKDCSAVVRA